MEIADEEFLTDDTAEKDVSWEAWPIPPADSVKDFEEYLMDLDLRF